MSFDPNTQYAPFVPTYTTLQVNEEQLRIVLTQLLTNIAYNVNIREIAQFENFEILNGQQFFDPTDPSNQKEKKYAFRKVFQTGAIASGATATIPHGITGETIFTHIYGGVVTSLPDFRPIPYPSVAGGGSTIEVRVDTTNIIIINGTGAGPNIVNGLIILEYLKS